MKKSVILLPLISLALVLPTTDIAINGYISGSTVYIIYDADEGAFSDGLNMKSFAVRKGITWGRLNAREKPSEAPISNDDQLQFGEWYYNNETILNSFVIDRDIKVTAFYEAKDTQHDFQLDSWPVLAKVISIAEKQDNPIQALHDNYNVGTLIGATKTIEFDGRTYTVRVIGENQDFQEYDPYKKAYSKPALLTFEFTQAVNYDIPYDYEETSNNFQISNVNEVLNNEFFGLFDNKASRYMKTVYKCTNVGNGTSTLPSVGNLEVTPHKVFPISLCELNADKYNEKAKEKQSSYVFPYEIEKESSDGQPYVYYAKAAELGESLARVDLDGEPRDYWTRSPEVQSPYFVWHINKDGSIGDPDYEQGGYMEQVPMDIGRSISVCPCFCY